MNYLLLFAFSTVIVTGSCKKNDKPGPNTGYSRTLSYELSGQFSGSLYATYTTAPGGIVTESVASIPWRKEITYAASITAATIAFAGNGGVAGQQVTITVKRGSTVVSTTPATAGSAGSFTVAAPVVVF